MTLFAAWLQTAIDTSVPEPHAMTLSTCGDDARPDARVLILKDLTADGFWFATSAHSAHRTPAGCTPRSAHSAAKDLVRATTAPLTTL